MSWAGRRKILYISIFLLLVGAITAPIAYKLTPKASCTDGQQNQGERDIDCEGPCANICLNLVSKVRIVWARPFPVGEKVFSAAAYVSNPNFDLGAERVPYSIKLYDDRNILIGERKGITDILPSASFPIFEGIIFSESRVPAKAFFEFTASPQWVKLPPQPVLSVKDINLTNEETAPRLTGLLVNDNIFPITDVRVVAIIYDLSDNAIAGSETIVERIEKDTDKTLVFTWPVPFTAKVGRVEIYPKLLKVQ